MRTASMVLGIVGGVLAIIFAIIFIMSGAVMSTGVDVVNDLDGLVVDIEGEDGNSVHVDLTENSSELFDTMAGSMVRAAQTWIWIAAILSLVGAVLAIIGGAVVKKKNVLAGIFMIIAAVLCLFTGLGFIATIVLILSAIFAFVKDNSQPQPAPPAVPAAE